MKVESINPVDGARKWLAELKFAKREDEKWIKRSKKIIKRYRDERTGYSDNAKRFNILWANVQTLMPAIYGKTPRAEVERRYKDQDPIGRTASIILQRCLQYEIDHYGDYDASMKQAVTDRLLPGRGVVWVRFETKEQAIPDSIEDQQEMEAEAQGLPEPEDYEYECTPVDYVFFEDFRCSPARCWDEVTWVARRVYMSRKDGIERFGEDFKDVPLTHEPIGLDELKNQAGEISDIEDLKKAQIWEIWDKTSKTVYWVAEGYSKTLDIKEDPLGLDQFWPCPRPLFATQTTDTLVPVPDFALYQDQADEIDMLTQRIAMLTEAVKVVGVYDASQPAVQRMLAEGVNNTLIAVDTWAAFAEKGGLKGTVDFMPIEAVLQALAQCYASREQAKQVVYEITGLSDIIRGASVASETATAQQIKSQYASLRLKKLQTEMAQFASEALRIKAQIMADFYSPQTLVEMSGIMGTQDAQYAEQAIQLLKSEPARNFRVEVATDSLVEMDEQAEKASRTEFLGAIGQFMERALPVAQQVPEMAPLMGEMILFAVRAFKGGRAMEAAFDDAVAKMNAPKPPQEQQPDPAMMQLQAQQQAEQAKMQAMQQSEQMKAQIEQAKMQGNQQLEAAKLQSQQQIEAARMEHERQMEAMRQEAETDRQMKKAELEASVKILVAQIGAQQAIAPATEQAANQEVQQIDPLSPMVQMHADMMQSMQGVMEALKAPKRRMIERGPDGRALGMIEVSEG